MKVAIFVEGHTEVEFVKSLISELAGRQNVAFLEERFYGGSFSVIYSDPSTGQRLEVLIANCCNDGKVVSAIRDRYAGLVAVGYSRIIGLRDIYPIESAKLPRVVHSMRPHLPQNPIPSSVVLAVAEVEAWFIEEETHFERIDITLTRDTIFHAVGYDIYSGDAENIIHPANQLHLIYGIGGKAYRKTANQVARTIGALDMANLYLNARQRSASLDRFIRVLEEAFAEV